MTALSRVPATSCAQWRAGRVRVSPGSPDGRPVGRFVFEAAREEALSESDPGRFMTNALGPYFRGSSFSKCWAAWRGALFALLLFYEYSKWFNEF